MYMSDWNTQFNILFYSDWNTLLISYLLRTLNVVATLVINYRVALSDQNFLVFQR